MMRGSVTPFVCAVVLAGCTAPALPAGGGDLAAPSDGGGADLAPLPDGAHPCPEPSPVGCRNAACPPNMICDTTVGCRPSACGCDFTSGTWVCTEDCGGGTCVPVPACPGPNPEGCRHRGCPEGRVCDLESGCAPSACTCDAATGSWACTPDCSGGICVVGKACSPPNPQGCRFTPCPEGKVCTPNLGCVPSICTCDPRTGSWVCTKDCAGGTCAP